MNSQNASKQPLLMTRLSLSDLRHEWVLSLCLIMAVSAVIAPLLLLFGLKYGTIETLRRRLIQDPRNREVRPLTSLSFPREWFDGVAARSDVAFLTPMTRQISATVTAYVISAGKKTERVDVDIIPTGENDPLLIENGSAVPAEGQCVLSAYAAEAMDAQPGDTIEIEATRLKGAKKEKGVVGLTVAGVLDIRAGGLKSIYVPLEMLEQVEAFKDGMGVPELGWKGDLPDAYPVYNGLFIVTKTSLPTYLIKRIVSSTGFTKSKDLTSQEAAELAGYPFPAASVTVQLYTQTRAVSGDSIEQVERLLRGRNATLLPWIRPMEFTLMTDPPTTISRVLALPDAARPWLGEDVEKMGKYDLAISRGMAVPDESTTAVYSNEQCVVRFPVHIRPVTAGDDSVAFMSPEIAGSLILAEQRPVRYDPASEKLLLYRRGFAGFRLYARTLEDVKNLRHDFEELNIPVHTEAEQIQTVMEMDRYLTMIFWLVAVVGIVGSAASLVASLYASVERKKRELSVLRLLGLSGGTLYRFPVIQGATLATGGFAMAMVFFGVIASVINRLFQAHLRPGERFCHLPAGYIIGAWIVTLLIACLAAGAAVTRLARIDPAEALRDE